MFHPSCIMFVPDDTARTLLPQPLMLTQVAGAPLLWHLSRSLAEGGVNRVFLVCHGQYLDAAKALFPEEICLTASDDEAAADLLHVFLSTDESETDRVGVITGPGVILPGAEADDPTCALTISREELMQALDEDIPFDAFLRENGRIANREMNLYPVQSAEDLLALQGVLQRRTLEALIRGGVRIQDPACCTVAPTAHIGRGTELLPGAMILGQSVIGEDCRIGPDARIIDSRLGSGCTVSDSTLEHSTLGAHCAVGPYAVVRASNLGEGCRVGSFAEVERSTLHDGVQVPRLAYIGDTEAGREAYFGAMSVTANFDRAAFHKTEVGDGAFVGAGVQLVAPVQVGDGAYLAAGSTVTEAVPAQALSVERGRQSAKKEWAAKHKLEETS